MGVIPQIFPGDPPISPGEIAHDSGSPAPIIRRFAGHDPMYPAIVQQVNCASLRAAFDRAGVRPSAYDLDPGRLSEERYCLQIVSGGWAVYYMERGRHVDEVVFETEDEACSELLLRVTSDPTTRTK